MGGTALNPLVVLGATGSIGRQTIEVADRIGVPIAAVAARTPSDAIVELGVGHPDAAVCVVDPGDQADRLRTAFGGRVHFGKGAITEAAAMDGVTVVNAVVGAAGLEASLSALYAGNRLALANKESLVAGGPLMTQAVAAGGGELLPVDSEHSAIWQCLIGEESGTVARLILTASGGPFRGMSLSDMESVTVADALAHPTWSMGPRITTDSATLMNKAFEVIEAHYLFDMPYDSIDVVVHPQSVVHSFVEFVDGVVKAEVGIPDMRKPIQAAIVYPDRVKVEHPKFDLVGTDLTFEKPDYASFPCLGLGYEAGRAGGSATAVLNAADEVAVEAFLAERIPFVGVAAVVGGTLTAHEVATPRSIEDILEVDAWARAHAADAVSRIEVR